MNKIVLILALGLFMVSAVGCSEEPKPATTAPAASSPATPSTNATKPTTSSTTTQTPTATPAPATSGN